VLYIFFFSADQTPTPTRFIRNCEEVGLFQDLQNVNPFEETFRKAVEAAKTGVGPLHEVKLVVHRLSKSAQFIMRVRYIWHIYRVNSRLVLIIQFLHAYFGIVLCIILTLKGVIMARTLIGGGGGGGRGRTRTTTMMIMEEEEEEAEVLCMKL